MSHDLWEDCLEEFCTSPEEAAGLKETASLFEQLPEAHYSTSFQDELKQKLLARAAEQGKARQHQGRIIYVLEKMRNSSRSRSIGLVAAAVLILFFAGSVLNNALTEPGKPEAGGPGSQETPLISDANGFLPHDSSTPLSDGMDVFEIPGPTEGPLQGDEGEDPAEQQDITSVEEGGTAPESSTQQSEPPKPTDDEQQDTKPDEEVVPPLPNDPDFKVFENRRTYSVAGNVVLNYGSASDELYAVEDVQYNWEPNKIVLAAEEEHSFGTTAWARKLLTDEGFRVNARDAIKVEMQETTQGLYAEIFYQVAPALVLHVHEDKGILDYYYEEKGDVAAKGYYALLTPAKALKQQIELKSSIDGQQLQFSFRTVRLTYHEFLVEKDGTEERMRLPAYSFTGSEKYQGKEAVSFYVPAVKK